MLMEIPKEKYVQDRHLLHSETSGKICQKTRLFKGNVLSILLYGSESWKMTKTINHKLEVFQNRCRLQDTQAILA